MSDENAGYSSRPSVLFRGAARFRRYGLYSAEKWRHRLRRMSMYEDKIHFVLAIVST